MGCGGSKTSSTVDLKNSSPLDEEAVVTTSHVDVVAEDRAQSSNDDTRATNDLVNAPAGPTDAAYEKPGNDEHSRDKNGNIIEPGEEHDNPEYSRSHVKRSNSKLKKKSHVTPSADPGERVILATEEETAFEDKEFNRSSMKPLRCFKVYPPKARPKIESTFGKTKQELVKNYQRLQVIDKEVLKIYSEIYEDPDDVINQDAEVLVPKLTEFAENEVEKVRALFFWVVLESEWRDDASILNETSRKDARRAMPYLAKQMSETFTNLCRHADVECRTIFGYCKTACSVPGKCLISMKHVWNEVIIDGITCNCDPLWSSGIFDTMHDTTQDRWNVGVRWQWNEEWFIVDDESFTTTHLKHQQHETDEGKDDGHLDESDEELIKRKDWEEEPWLGPISGSILDSDSVENAGKICSSEENEIVLSYKIRASFDLELSAKLLGPSWMKGEPTDDISQNVLLSQNESEATLIVRLPKKGRFLILLHGEVVVNGSPGTYFRIKRLLLATIVEGNGRTWFRPLPCKLPRWGVTGAFQRTGCVYRDKAGIDLPVIECDGSVDLQIELPTSGACPLKCDIYNEDGRVVEGRVCLERLSYFAIAHAHFPTAGEYALVFWLSTQPSSNQNEVDFDLPLAFFIKSKSHSSTTYPTVKWNAWGQTPMMYKLGLSHANTIDNCLHESLLKVGSQDSIISLEREKSNVRVSAAVFDKRGCIISRYVELLFVEVLQVSINIYHLLPDGVYELRLHGVTTKDRYLIGRFLVTVDSRVERWSDLELTSSNLFPLVDQSHETWGIYPGGEELGLVLWDSSAIFQENTINILSPKHYQAWCSLHDREGKNVKDQHLYVMLEVSERDIKFHFRLPKPEVMDEYVVRLFAREFNSTKAGKLAGQFWIQCDPKKSDWRTFPGNPHLRAWGVNSTGVSSKLRVSGEDLSNCLLYFGQEMMTEFKVECNSNVLTVADVHAPFQEHKSEGKNDSKTPRKGINTSIQPLKTKKKGHKKVTYFEVFIEDENSNVGERRLDILVSYNQGNSYHVGATLLLASRDREFP